MLLHPPFGQITHDVVEFVGVGGNIDGVTAGEFVAVAGGIMDVGVGVKMTGV
jgi:hypothetical protein